jgi:hypothetical protein
MRRGAALVVLLGVGVSGLTAASAGFQRGTGSPGASSLSGVVIADDTGQAIRGARISLTGEPIRVERNAITDDDGRFVLSALPAGRFTLKASKTGYVTMEYGQAKPRRLGTPVDLADLQAIDGFVLRLPRGAVITGTILDESDDPAAGTLVHVMRYDWPSGAHHLVEVAGDQADDRGMYRVYGLPAGEYVISAVPRLDVGDLNQTVRDTQGLAAVRASQTPGAVLLASFFSAVAPDERPIGYAPIFYPGTPMVADAAAVTVAAGEERGAVDFRLRLVGVSRIEGTVSTPDGTVQGVSVSLMDSSALGPRAAPGSTVTTAADGRFVFTRIVPGTYTLLARRGRAGSPAMRWGMTPLTIDGHDVLDTSIGLQAGVTVGGHVRLVASMGGAAAEPGATNVQIELQPVDSIVAFGSQLAIPVERDGTFAFTGVVPGRYLLEARTPADTGVKSVIIGDRDMADLPFDVKPGENVTTIAVVLAGASTELSGVVQDPVGKPAPDCTIVVFSADRRYWSLLSRRIQAVRPAMNGTYVVRNLPAGDYRIAAVADVEVGAWFDPSFLDQLVAASRPVTIGDGEHRIQDLRIGR